MNKASAKKILDLIPKINKKSNGTAEPIEKLKNRIEKKFSKLTDEQKKLKEQFKSENKKTLKELKALQTEIDTIKKESSALLDKFSAFSDTTSSEIREELTHGIELVGDRVSTAINELNEKMDGFSNRIDQRIEEMVAVEKETQERDNPFGSLKEGELVEMDDFEVVPKDAIETLTKLFKNQTVTVKNFINKQEQKMNALENNHKTLDEENSQLFELINKRIERNFRFFIYAAAIILVLIFVISLI
jgi:hypothetical protein